MREERHDMCNLGVAGVKLLERGRSGRGSEEERDGQGDEGGEWERRTRV